MENTHENTRKFVREGTIIKYNKEVINNEDTDIIFHIFEDENISKNVAIFVLKYNINKDGKTIPYQVVLGKIELTKNDGQLIEKAKIIRDYLLAQLKMNSKGKNNYQYCKQLDTICVKKQIPYIYTNEGIQIVTNSEHEDTILERTYTFEEENNIMKVRCLNPDKRMDLYASETSIRQKITENIRRQQMTDVAMTELENNDDKEKFLKGKKIDNLRRETSNEVIFCKKDSIIAYILKQYEEKKEEIKPEHKITLEEYMKIKRYLEEHNINKKIDPSIVIGSSEEESNLERYFRLKEKSLAIDIRKMLENAQNDYIEQQTNNENNNIAEDDVYSYISNCKNIFDSIKQEKDFNTQFCYKRTIGGDFEKLYSIVELQGTKKDKNGEPIYNVEEILQYLKLKEKVLKETDLGKNKSFMRHEIYDENKDIKKLVDFVINTKSRKDTIRQEKEMISEFYREVIEDIIKKNSESINLYNNYAKRFNLEICPVGENPHNPNMDNIGSKNVEELEENSNQQR